MAEEKAKEQDAPNATQGYLNYCEQNGDLDLSFLDNIPAVLDFVRNGQDDDFPMTDERFGNYLAKCADEKRKVAAYTFVDFFYKQGDWFTFPLDHEFAEADETDEDEPSDSVQTETDESGETVAVRSRDYASFIENVQNVPITIM